MAAETSHDDPGQAKHRNKSFLHEPLS